MRDYNGRQLGLPTNLNSASAHHGGSTSSLASSTSSKMSKFYGNITIEMIDDFLNPKTRAHTDKLPAARSTTKVLGPPTTQGVGLIEYSDEEDDAAALVSKGVDPRRHFANVQPAYRKNLRDFDYVQSNKDEILNELTTAMVRSQAAERQNQSGESFVSTKTLYRVLIGSF